MKHQDFKAPMCCHKTKKVLFFKKIKSNIYYLYFSSRKNLKNTVGENSEKKSIMNQNKVKIKVSSLREIKK